MIAKILFIHHVGVRGGAGTMLANVITELDRTRFSAVVICPKGDVMDDFRAAGAEVRETPRPIYQFQHMSGYEKSVLHPRFIHSTWMMWKDRFFWRDYIRESGFDIVHLNAITLAPMAWSAKMAGTKVLCLVQETAVRGLLGIRNTWLRYILPKWIDVIVYISEYDYHTWNIDASHVEVVPNWVDFDKFDRNIPQTDARNALGFPKDSKIILFMGGINSIKGTIPLLRALKRLTDIENLLLVVAGYCESFDMLCLSRLQQLHVGLRTIIGLDYYRNVMNFVNRHDLKSHVWFTGMTDQVVLLYSAADVVVFPAVEPHQARPVLEAGAMGKPVVVSNFKNLAEFVVHEKTGLTVPPNDVGQLATALRRILMDALLARRLGDGNYNMARTNHDRAINGPKLGALYERLLVQ